MSRLSRVFAVTATLATLTAVSAQADDGTQAPSRGNAQSAASYVRCGSIDAAGPGRLKVLKKGRVTCRGARKLMHLFLNEGQGIKHGGPSSAETYYTLYGWKCGTGAGGGGCKRRGARVQAGWVQ